MSKVYNSKEDLISYLNNHLGQDVSRLDIIKDTGISKARLSEQIKELKSEGYNIVTPPRSGLVRLTQGEISQTIMAADVRQWLIIYILSKEKRCTYVELIQHLLGLNDSAYMLESKTPWGVYKDSEIQEAIGSDISGLLSVYTLRKDLQQLMDLKYVEQGKIRDKDGLHDKYWLSEGAPSILFEDDDKVADFFNYASEPLVTAVQPLESAIDKLKNIYNWDEEDKVIAFLGRSRSIAKEEMDCLNQFLLYPYKENQLDITYYIKEKESHSKIMVGRLFFSTETGCFYVLCKEEAKKGRQIPKIKKLTGIKAAKPIGVNTFWKSQEAKKIYEEILTGSEDAPEQVVVLFKDTDNIIEQVKGLQGLRPFSKLKKLEKPIEDYDYVYTDTVRGTTNMANYLRSFGVNALALAPEKLRKNMKRTYDKTIDLYMHKED